MAGRALAGSLGGPDFEIPAPVFTLGQWPQCCRVNRAGQDGPVSLEASRNHQSALGAWTTAHPVGVPIPALSQSSFQKAPPQGGSWQVSFQKSSRKLGPGRN